MRLSCKPTPPGFSSSFISLLCLYQPLGGLLYDLFNPARFQEKLWQAGTFF
jgi:hypothetical protein